MNLEFDMKQMLADMMLMALVEQQNADPRMRKAIEIFKKHGISALDGLAILMEMSVAFDEIEKQKETTKESDAETR